MNSPLRRFTFLLFLVVRSAFANDDGYTNKYQNYQDWENQYYQNQNGGGGDDYYNDDGGQADEAAVDGYYNDNSNSYENNGSGYQQGSDYIKYWTDYAILPKRCIT
jgi:hypothetical protein